MNFKELFESDLARYVSIERFGWTRSFLYYYRRVSTCNSSLLGKYYKFRYRRICEKHGIEIPRTTKIGRGLYIGHPYNITINPKAVLGDNINIHKGLIYSGDVFYKENEDYKEMYEKYKCLGVEMESFALFHNANILSKKASCLLTVSNSFVTNEETTSEEREKSFNTMIKLALESVIENKWLKEFSKIEGYVCYY